MTVTRTKIESSMEDKILVGMIVSDRYLGDVRNIYHPDFIDGQFGRSVAQWCLDYYKQYEKAPGIHIKDIFDEKVRQGLDHDIADMVERFLGRISNEFEKAPNINIDYLLDETEKEFKLKNTKLISEDIAAALEQGEDVEDINAMLKEFLENRIDVRSTDFEDSIRTSTQLIEEKITMPKAIVWPWLRESSINMVCAERGIGKTWFGLILAVAITRERYEDLIIGPWVIKRQCGVFYVDGEMGKWDLKDRIRQIAEPLGAESRRFPLRTFSTPDYSEKHQVTVNLLQPYWQDRLYKYLTNNRSIRLLILDNMGCLFTGRDENDNQEASIINSWLIKVRALGVAILLVHHAGKGGQQRGASALEDPLNNSIMLRKPKEKSPSGAHFVVDFTKSRNDPGGDGYRPFSLLVEEHDDNPRWRKWTDI